MNEADVAEPVQPVTAEAVAVQVPLLARVTFAVPLVAGLLITTVAGLVANEETCRGYVEISPSMATALNPLIGYDQAAEIAKRSFRERRPVRELAREMTSLTPEEIDQALDPRRQTEPGLEPGGGGG